MINHARRTRHAKELPLVKSFEYHMSWCQNSKIRGLGNQPGLIFNMMR